MHFISLSVTKVVKGIIGIVLFSLFVGAVFQYTFVSAGVGESVSGFAWGGTASADGAYRGIGWISMNSLTDGSAVDYGVNIPSSNGDITGYAWSEHYGWISFNGSDLSGCSPALYSAERVGDSIKGGARIISIRDAGGNAGGYDGCISLNGAGYGLSVTGSISPYTLSGYAWSSNLGWIDFSGVEVQFSPAADLSIVPCDIPLGSNSCNASFTWNITDSPSPNLYNQNTSNQYSTNPSGTNVLFPVDYGNNVIEARDGSITISSESITVNCSGIGVYDSSGVCIDPRPNLSQPSVTYSLSSSFDSTTGNYSSVTAIFQTSNTGGSDAPNSQYRVEFDNSTQGYSDTKNSALGTLARGASVNRSEIFTNVPFGPTEILVVLDTNDDVTEIDETDNTRLLEIVIPPPDPGIVISSNRTQVRFQDTVLLSWTKSTDYSLDCTLKGPAGVNVDPVNFPDSVTTGPITGKSEYILSCTEPITGTVFTDSVVVETIGRIEEI